MHRHQHRNSLTLAAQYHFSKIQDIAGELVRNSLDAGAKAVTITLMIEKEEFGVRVTDDASKAFAADLSSLDLIGESQIDSRQPKTNMINKIPLYGFRGRSLVFIAQLAQQLIIKTRLNQEYVTKTIKVF